MRILALLNRYGTELYPDALHDLKNVYSLWRGAHQVDIVISDNSLEPSFHAKLASDVELIGGDNRLSEFSGWQKAITHVGSALDTYDLINFVTDAFNNDYSVYLYMFTPRILELVRELELAVGHIDAYPEPVRILGTPLSHWVRSGFFFTTPSAVQRMGSVITVDGDGLFSEDISAPFLESEDVISNNYKQYISGWLIGDGKLSREDSPYRKQFSLNQQTWPLFKRKTVAIINELGLSLRLRQAGILTIEVEWIYDALLQGATLNRKSVAKIRARDMFSRVQRNWRSLGIQSP